MHKLLHFIFGMCCFISAAAQQDATVVTFDTATLKSKQISTEDLRKYNEDEAFNYEITKTERTWWDDFKTWLGNLLLRIFEALFGIEKAGSFLATFLRIVPYLLLGILIYLLIKFFLNVNANSLRHTQNSQNLVALSEEENIIRNENILVLIRNAVAEKNYRLAIRYYYLHVLKLMSEKELITWQVQKTNDDYLREIEQTELERPFKGITRLYDYIWYGDFPIDEVRYQKAEKEFTNLDKMVNGNG